MNVLIVGAGRMGAGISQVFLTGGWQVYLYDLSDSLIARGINVIDAGLSRMVEKGNLTADDSDRLKTRIHPVTDFNMDDPIDLVIEAVVENMAVKKNLFAELDKALPPETILASNTSSMSITEIAAATSRPEQCIGMHFFNPAPVMKLVEIIRGNFTSDETVETIKSWISEIGKTGIEVQEGPGFVVNRILMVMINEAIGIYSEGLASPAGIDQAMMLGANHPMGPLALADLIGNDVVLAVLDVLYEETGNPKYHPHPMLKKMIRAGLLGRKSKRGFYNY